MAARCWEATGNHRFSSSPLRTHNKESLYAPAEFVARRLWLSTLALVGLAVLVGCPKKDAGTTGTDFVPGQKVSGHVTYEGQTVPFGVVLFFSPEKSRKEGGKMLPVSSALIGADGSYTVPNILLGG